MLYYACCWQLRLLPLELASTLSGITLSKVGAHLSRHRRAVRNISRMMPDTSATERERILREMWFHLGQTFAETLLLDKIAAGSNRIALSAACRSALKYTKLEGAIIVAPHLGNWEVAAIPLAAISDRHAAVYRQVKNPLVDKLLLAIRGPFYRGGMFAKGQNAARSLMRHARSGGSIGIMADQRTPSGSNVAFFGFEAPSTTMPAMLARQFRRPLFAVCMVRIGAARFRMEVNEIGGAPNRQQNA